MTRRLCQSVLFVLALALANAACGDSGGGTHTEAVSTPTAPAGPVTPQQLRVHVLRSLPHDRKAFTQGLLFYGGAFYESTGMQGQSSLRHVEVDTGKVLRRVDLAPTLFGEGLARVGDQLVQLTWTTQEAFVYDMLSLRQVGELTYAGEGWGLCFNGEHLVMSNGSDHLAFRDPVTFDIIRELRVTRTGTSVNRLNELECVGDTVYANVWTTDTIVAIDANDGHVAASIDASGLLTPEEEQGTDVLNGIAYDKRSGHFFITGKYWPKMFEVEFVASEPGSP